MQVICTECDKKLNVSDASAGKRMRCPGCKASILVPAKKTAAKKSADPDDADDEREEDEAPPKKSKTGLIVGVLGCGALLLLLGVGLAGGGAWYFLFRDKAPPAGPEANKGDDTPAAKDFKLTLAKPRIDRFGDQIQVFVDYEVANPKPDESVAIMLVFPSNPNASTISKLVLSKELQAATKGTWSSAKFQLDPSVRQDTACDIVARVATDVGQITTGKEAARLAKVAIPAGAAGTVRVSNLFARRNAAKSSLIEFQFDFAYIGDLPKSNIVWFEAELADPPNKGRRLPLTFRVGPNIKDGTIECSAEVAGPIPDTCNFYVSDVQSGSGNLYKAMNVRIEPATTVPTNFTLELSNAKVERDSLFPNVCHIGVDVQAKGQPRNVLYRCAVVYYVQGNKEAPVEFGPPTLGPQLVKGVPINVRSLVMPQAADNVCDLIIREHLTGNNAVLAEVKNITMIGGVKPPPPTDKLVALSNIRVSRIDDFHIQVQFNYEFTRAPEPAKWYTMMVQRNDIKDKLITNTGPIVWQFRGDKVQPKGVVDLKVMGNQLGMHKSYRVWAASGQNQLDAIVKESTIHIVKPGAGPGPAPSGKMVTLSNVKVDKLDDDHVRVQADYEFSKDPDPKKGYALLVQRADVDDKKAIFNPIVKQELGEKWPKSGQVKNDVQANGKGTEYKVWLVEVQGMPLSDYVTVTAGAAGRDDGKEPIQISSAKLTSFGKKGSTIEVSYQFTGLSKPAAKSVYTFVLAPKGGNPVPFFQVTGAKMATQGTFPFGAAFVLGRETEIDVYIIDASAANRLISNRKRVDIKK